MPKAIRRHKPRTIATASKTLSERRRETGRTLALNGAVWRRLRASVLAEQPLCPRCSEQGYPTLAKEVDHVDGDPTNNLRDNLEGLCKMHHGQKTRREQAGNHQQPTACEPRSPARTHDRICRGRHHG